MSNEYFAGPWPPVLPWRPMAETEWLTIDEAREAFAKLRDLNGNKACAVEVRQPTATEPRTHRLLFAPPAGRETFGTMRLGEGGPLLPAYVALDAKMEAKFARSPVMYFPEDDK